MLWKPPALTSWERGIAPCEQETHLPTLSLQHFDGMLGGFPRLQGIVIAILAVHLLQLNCLHPCC